MSEPRVAVLEQLAEKTDPDGDRTTTIEAIAAALGLGEDIAEDHVHGLATANLATFTTDGEIRITITGEQFLALDVDDVVVVESLDGDAEE